MIFKGKKGSQAGTEINKTEYASKEELNEMVAIETAYVLADAIDERMGYKKGRTRRLVELVKEMCRRLNKDEDFTQRIVELALIHDVGMLSATDAVLFKQGRLNDDEIEVIKKHVLSSDNEIIRAHHERYDGKGYPDGLEEKNIPYEARFLAVADAYISMTSKRPYRDVLSQGTVRGELIANKVSQFDPVIADVVIDMIDEDPWYKLREE